MLSTATGGTVAGSCSAPTSGVYSSGPSMSTAAGRTSRISAATAQRARRAVVPDGHEVQP